jgi:hypothetical protein
MKAASKNRQAQREAREKFFDCIHGLP